MKDPGMYLSHDATAWRVIYQGVPLCRDTTEESARRVYAMYRGTKHPAVPATYNGDTGEWDNIPASPVSGSVVEVRAT